MEMFRPPVNRMMKVLDRSFFQKNIPISVAKIVNKQHTSQLRQDLSQDRLYLDRIPSMARVPDDGRMDAKALLLRPEIKVNDASTWSKKLQEVVDAKEVVLMPYSLRLDYDYWSYHEIMTAIVGDDQLGEFPTGFSIVGHVAHLNLREKYLPYKHLVAQVLIDKTPSIRTVINKTDLVGSESEFRTFTYEILAGPPDLNVEAREGYYAYRFDFSKVYWNPRLQGEHSRLVDLFQQGEAVCDVMAGVGPFAVPAGGKKVFVWANDLNPDSYTSLKDAIVNNKVTPFVRAFNQAGETFIRYAAQSLLRTSYSATYSAPTTPVNSPPSSPSSLSSSPTRTRRRKKHRQIKIQRPRTFSHFIMNLPASAIDFLRFFIGIYAGYENLFEPYTSAKPPMIHFYYFSSKKISIDLHKQNICEEISRRLDTHLELGDPDFNVIEVRDVSPGKSIYRASFRLPREVAFRNVHMLEEALERSTLKT